MLVHLSLGQGLANQGWDLGIHSAGGRGLTVVRVCEELRHELQLVRARDGRPLWHCRLSVTNSFGVCVGMLLDLAIPLDNIAGYVSMGQGARKLEEGYAGLAKSLSRYDGCLSVSSPAVLELLASGVVPYDGAAAVLVNPAFSAAVASSTEGETWPLVDPLSGAIVHRVSPRELYSRLLEAKMVLALGIAWQSDSLQLPEIDQGWRNGIAAGMGEPS